MIVHNAYQERGGEDSVMESESALLRAKGHAVDIYSRHNDEVNGKSRLGVAVDAIWSSQTTREMSARIAAFRPDVIHVHNTLPLISPSVYWAASRMGVPVVQTLHNFRLLCPQAMFVREGRVCEDCLGRLPLPGIRRGCYRESSAQTAVVAATYALHGALGTFRNKVQKFVVLNEFCRRKFVEGGLRPEQLVVKPNFVEVNHQPGLDPRDGVIFLGRLTTEKGLPTLLDAVQRDVGRQWQDGLRVLGHGPMSDAVRQALGDRYLGSCPSDQIWGHLRRAACMVVPSVWYEGFPRTIVEAYAVGLPVIASRLGSLAEVVEDGRTGLLFEPGNAQDLAAKLAWAQAHPAEMAEMGRRARAVYEQKYTPEVGYRALISVYEDAIAALPGS